MNRKPLFFEMFFLFLMVGVLNFVANKYHLYWKTMEFDSIVHFFGGAALSAFFVWFYFFSGYFSPKKRTLGSFFLVAAAGSMFIAVSWEIYELIFGEALVLRSEYPFDTTLDFIMDFLGVTAACLYGFLKEISLRARNSRLEARQI